MDYDIFHEEDREPSRPFNVSIQPITEAAAAMPDSVRQFVGVLGRLALAPVARATKDPFGVLEEVLVGGSSATINQEALSAIPLPHTAGRRGATPPTPDAVGQHPALASRRTSGSPSRDAKVQPGLLDGLLAEYRQTASSKRSVPANRLLCCLRTLDDVIRRDLQRPELRNELALDDSDRNHCQARLNDKGYEISFSKLLVLRALIHAAGNWIKSDEIVASHGKAFRKIRVDRCVGDLPEPIRRLVERRPGHGGGYRLVLG